MAKVRGFKHEGIADLRIESAIARDEKFRIIGKLKTKGHFLRKKFQDVYECEFQLYRGSDKYPKTQIMTFSDANKLNKEYTKKYIENLDKGNGTRLWQWRIVDYEEYTRKKRMFIERQL